MVVFPIAYSFLIARRLIQFTLDTDKLEVVKNQFAERQKDGRYYDKDKHKQYMKSHRDHKKELWKKGELKDKE